VVKKFILTSKPAVEPYLPAELREIYDQIAAYGRKVRTTTGIANQAYFEKMNTEVNDYLCSPEKDGKYDAKIA